MPNCITGSLAPYTGVWDKKQIKHLYNRIGNGANLEDISEGLASNPNDIVNALVDEAIALPLPTPEFFPWAETPYSGAFFGSGYRYQAFQNDFGVNQVLNPVKYKLTLFWHGHFATNIQGYQATFTYLHYRLLQQYAWGNFKEFTEKMGLDPRMLRYLNGRENRVGNPNENYARELLELFTLGEGNHYEQIDVENIARAFTGWWAGHHEQNYNDGLYILYPDQKILFPDGHDWGEINLFEQTLDAMAQPADLQEATDAAHARYLWVHDTIFEQKTQILAQFICRKLYKFYVYHEANETIVQSLAATFINNNWEIVPVLKQLFKSQHFFDENAIGVCFKSGIQLNAMYVRQTGYVYGRDWFPVSPAWVAHPDYNHELPWANDSLVGTSTSNNYGDWLGTQTVGQLFFQPPNVAGWPGGRHWITESSLVNRRTAMASVLRVFLPHVSEDSTAEAHIRNFLYEVSGSMDDPEIITRAVIEHYFVQPLDEVHIAAAIVVFKHTFQAYYDNGEWNINFTWVSYQYRKLMLYLLNLPEFQLC